VAGSPGWSLYGGLFESFLLLAVFSNSVFFLPLHFIFVNSSRAHIGFGNCGFLFSFTPCLLSFFALLCLVCFAFRLAFFIYFIPITKVTRLRCLRRYEATKLRSLTTLWVRWSFGYFHSCLLTWTQFFLAFFFFALIFLFV